MPFPRPEDLLSKFTPEQKKAGAYTDTNGNPVEMSSDPPADVEFPVIVGPWPNPNLGARQVRCTSCKGFGGVSPMGWRIHKVAPELRPFLCWPCARILSIVQEARAKP